MQWPAFDDTEIGERGVSVSGGQKARISLARTIYSDADLIILDDPLSAVDAHVGKSIMQNCIQGHLVKNKKTVVLVTHQLQYLHCASKILVLNRQGVQVFYGSYEELKKEREVYIACFLSHLNSVILHDPTNFFSFVGAVVFVGREQTKEKSKHWERPHSGGKGGGRAKCGDNLR